MQIWWQIMKEIERIKKVEKRKKGKKGKRKIWRNHHKNCGEKQIKTKARLESGIIMNHPDFSRFLQNNPESFRIIQIHTESSRIIHIPPESSRIFQNSSRILPVWWLCLHITKVFSTSPHFFLLLLDFGIPKSKRKKEEENIFFFVKI